MTSLRDFILGFEPGHHGAEWRERLAASLEAAAIGPEIVRALSVEREARERAEAAARDFAEWVLRCTDGQMVQLYERAHGLLASIGANND